MTMLTHKMIKTAGKRKERKVIPVLFFFAAVLLIPFCVLFLTRESPKSFSGYAKLQPGDTFFYGTYDKDTHSTNDSDLLEWIVVEKTDDSLVAITKYILEVRFWDDREDQPESWENCEIYSFLNTKFIDKAFSEKELSRLMVLDEQMNPDDLVGLLSAEEAFTCLSDEDRKGIPTSFAKENGGSYVGYGKASDPFHEWWICSSRGEGSVAMYVNAEGTAAAYPSDPLDYRGLRPVIRIAIK